MTAVREEDLHRLQDLHAVGVVATTRGDGWPHLRAIACARLAQYLHLPNYINSFLRQGFTEDDLEHGGSDRLVDGLVAWGTLDVVLERIAQYHTAGADHVAIQVLNSTDYQPTNPLPRTAWRQLAAPVGRGRSAMTAGAPVASATNPS